MDDVTGQGDASKEEEENTSFWRRFIDFFLCSEPEKELSRLVLLFLDLLLDLQKVSDFVFRTRVYLDLFRSNYH